MYSIQFPFKLFMIQYNWKLEIFMNTRKEKTKSYFSNFQT